MLFSMRGKDNIRMRTGGVGVVYGSNVANAGLISDNDSLSTPFITWPPFYVAVPLSLQAKSVFAMPTCNDVQVRKKKRARKKERCTSLLMFPFSSLLLFACV